VVLLIILRMAVQPDRRAWDEQVAASGGTLTERYRLGVYTLRAPEREVQPLYFFLRSDRPGFEKGRGVGWQPHGGWTTYDGAVQFASRLSPLECLRWWVKRQGK